MFKVCPKCDFEWHQRDGSCCPACHRSLKENPSDESKRRDLHFNGEPQNNKLWAQALAIITLVVLIVLWVSA